MDLSWLMFVRGTGEVEVLKVLMTQARWNALCPLGYSYLKVFRSPVVFIYTWCGYGWTLWSYMEKKNASATIVKQTGYSHNLSVSSDESHRIALIRKFSLSSELAHNIHPEPVSFSPQRLSQQSLFMRSCMFWNILVAFSFFFFFYQMCSFCSEVLTIWKKTARARTRPTSCKQFAPRVVPASRWTTVSCLYTSYLFIQRRWRGRAHEREGGERPSGRENSPVGVLLFQCGALLKHRLRMANHINTYPVLLHCLNKWTFL